MVDEEHDTSYKQDDVVYYNARDMAVLRASVSGAHVVLASATPSLESWVNAANGKYHRLDLRSRYGQVELPQMQAIDMRGETLPAGEWISQPLAQAIQTRLDKGEQSLIFLNRRGFAPITICRACGQQIGCYQCDARTSVLSSDLFPSPQALKEAIVQIAAGDNDIIIGTQIVAKGHNFPRLTFVGVVDADLGLQGADLRAGERSFQLMRQAHVL